MARLESDVAHIRSDIADIKADIRGLRSEIGGMRADMMGIDKSLRAELHGAGMSLRSMISELDQRLTRGLAANRVWMLLQSAAILGVMAHGFKWL